MNIKLIIVIVILLILVSYLLYRLFLHRESFQTTSSSININLQELLKNDPYQRNLANGLVNYYGSIFEYKNSHNFVFKKNNNELSFLGVSSGVANIESLDGSDINNISKIYSNHGAFCFLTSGDVRTNSIKIKSFGLKEYGGELPVILQRIRDIKAIFSTENKFCALGLGSASLFTANNAFIWPTTDPDGFTTETGISKVFSNKTHFSFIKTDNTLSTYPELQNTPTFNSGEIPVIIYSNNYNFIVVYTSPVSGSSPVNKAKIWGNETFSRNKQKIEDKDDIKGVFTNDKSILVVYGTDNKIACCGQVQFFIPTGFSINSVQQINTRINNINNIISVYSNKGAYCLLKDDGTIINLGKSNYISQMPDSSEKFKYICSNYGAFAGITFEDNVITWGLEKHGGKLTIDTGDVKRIIPNGDSEGGAFLIIKTGSANVLTIGNSSYGGDQEINIRSDSVNTVTTNDKAFFIITGRTFPFVNAVTGPDSREFIAGYPDEPIQILNKYYDNQNLSKFYDFTSNDFQDIFNKIFSDLSFTEQTQSVFEQTTPTIVTLPSTFKYWNWELTNNSDNTTFHPNNTDNQWKLETEFELNSGITFLGQDGVFINQAQIKYEVKQLTSPLISLCFAIKFLEIDEDFDIINFTDSTENKIKIRKEGKQIILTINGNKKENRSVNITSNEFLHFTYVFNEDNIKVYKNGSIQHSGQTPEVPNLNIDNTNLVIGDTSTVTLFNIRNLMLFDNYNLNQDEINNIFSNNNFNLIIPTTSPLVTTNTTNTTNTINTIDTQETIPSTTLIQQDFIDIKIKKNFFNINKFIVTTTQDSTDENIIVTSKLNKNANLLNEFKLRKDSSNILRKLNFDSNGDFYSFEEPSLNIKSYLIEYNVNKDILNCYKYLDIERINTIYNEHGNNKIYIFMYGEIEEALNNDIKNEICFIIYKDEDDIMRFEEIKQDLNFLHKTFLPDIRKITVDSSDQDAVKEIYNKFKDGENKENIRKQYSHIMNTEDRDENITNIIENMTFDFNENNKKVETLLIYNSKKNTNFRCSYIPQGETLFECKLICNNQKLNCSKAQCNDLCETCTKENCTWNIVRQENERLIKPEKSIIKGFSGNKMIKITWVKPVSKSSLIKYYIILTKPNDNEFIEIYTYENHNELLEYIVPNLENEIPYSVSIVSKNKIGISESSNIETVVPNENNDLNVELSFDTGDNSLQNMLRNKDVDTADLSQQKSIYEKDIIIKELKLIINHSLNIQLPRNTLNINIF